MPTPVRTPRINNNDDSVRFTKVHRAPGTALRKGDVIAEVETDKASFMVEAEHDGYLLGFAQTPGEMVDVGSVLAWIGDSADEPMPAGGPSLAAAAAGPQLAREPTLKASFLLRQHGLSPGDVPAAGDRLTADDVLAYVARHRVADGAPRAERPRKDDADLAPGDRTSLSVTERGMLRTVLWHRDHAVPGYVEIEYDGSVWERYASTFQQRHRLLMTPLLPLMAYRLVRLAAGHPRLNSTIVDGERHAYRDVNLGFTMQSGARLTLLSVRNAGALGEKEFVDALGLLMRQASKEQLTIEQTSGVTVSFSSMSRWQVARHVPVLPPFTSLIVAHAQASDGQPRFGASYDHRVLTGGEVAVVLRALSVPDTEGEIPA